MFSGARTRSPSHDGSLQCVYSREIRADGATESQVWVKRSFLLISFIHTVNLTSSGGCCSRNVQKVLTTRQQNGYNHGFK